ncbi:hypothetical protein J3R30DRAFT_2189325 [Lentinula aciculospora]|uniref:Protein kinase domain-containing protein n=1 Tax=Lentinula aciculospora TaxID=153920 RepID=A0A9W9AIS6_9AGAR|nr:hypothetical protein J3R30DRAFT_2189325 [Lentinula aciculospora]
MFIIQGSEINNVGGDHVIVTNNHLHHPGYQTRILAGKPLRTVSLEDVFLRGTKTRVTQNSQGFVKVIRSFHPASVAGLGDSSHFTVVTYEGPDAKEVFRDDIVRYAGLRHPNLAQLFGTLHYDTPRAGMLLHSELVPLQYFTGQCASNPLAFSYVKYRFLVDSVAAAEVTGLLHRYIPPDEFWMQPTSGLICIGPLGPSYSSPRNHENFYALWPRDSDYFQRTTIPQLEYNDYDSAVNIIKHIEQHFSTFESFVGSHLGSKSVEVLIVEGSLFSLSFGSVISVFENDDCFTLSSQRLLAQACLEDVTYSVGRWSSFYLPESDDGSTSENEHNGWTRVSYSSSQNFFPSYFLIDLEAHMPDGDLEAAWLTQAGHILQFNTSNKYVFIGSKIRMILQIPASSPLPNPTCAYLFIAPVKIDEFTRFSFDETPYYWSMDPFGAHRMSEEEQELSGLPSFELGIYEGRQWSDMEHSAISRYLEYKGFNPLESDYAQSRGYSVFEVTGLTTQDEESAAMSDGR